MRICTFVSSTALATVLFAASLQAGKAFAQKGAVLSPSTAWAVTKVESGQGPYCALARRYNRDTVMTIAQNDRMETSFALDFQRPTFQTGQKLAVVLDPGAGQQRSYDVEPVSGRAFVVRLGPDAPFFEALERTGMLRVEAAGQSYHFSLADFDAGQSRLDSCVAAMVEPAAGAESASGISGAPEAARVAEGGGSYRQEINALRRENEDLRERLNSMQAGAAEAGQPQDEGARAALEALRAENETLKSDLAILRQDALSLEDVGMFADMEQEIEALRKENLRLGNALEAAHGGFRAEMEKLKAQNQELTAQAETMRQKQQEEGDYREKFAAIEAKNRELESRLAGKAENTEIMEELRRKMTAMEGENRSLKEEASRLAAAAAESERNGGIVEETRKDSEEKIAALQADVARLQHENEQKNLELLDAGKEISELRMLQEEVEVLRGKLAAAETQSKSEAQEVEHAAVEASRETGRLAAENERLAQELAAARISAEEVSGLRQEISTLQARNRELEKSLSDAQSSAELSALHEENGRLRAQIGEKDKRIEELLKAENEPPQAQESEDARVSQMFGAEDFAAPHVSRSGQNDAETLPEVVEAQVENPDGLSEAQIQERAVHQNISRRQAEPRPENTNLIAQQSGPAADVASPEAPLSVRRSEDPFAAIDVEPVSAADEAPEPSAASAENGGELLAAADDEIFSPAIAIPVLLSRANHVQPAAVERVEGASGPDQLAYQWRSEGIYGTAEQKPIVSATHFDEMVKDYLLRAQKRCPGEFAVVPDDTTGSHGGRADSYDIACVGADVSSGASLLFFDREGTFTVVTYEAPAEDLVAAIDYRDQMKKALAGT